MVKFRTLLMIGLVILPTSIVFAGPSEDLAGMMRTLQSNLGPLYKLVVAVSYVMGIWFVTDSIMKLKKYGQARTMMSTNASMGKPIALMAIGASLIYFPTFVNVSIRSLWTYGASSSVLRYPAESGLFTAFVNPIIDMVRLFGLIAIIRGLSVLTRISHENTQPGTMGKGMMHILAGTLAVNIVGTMKVIRATFGFD